MHSNFTYWNGAAYLPALKGNDLINLTVDDKDLGISWYIFEKSVKIEFS